MKFRYVAAATHTVTSSWFCEEDFEGFHSSQSDGRSTGGVRRRASALP